MPTRRRAGTRTRYWGEGGSRAPVKNPVVPTLMEPRCRSCLQGARQWVTVDFPRTVRVSQLHIQFQGGFSSRLCTLEGEELLLGCLWFPLSTPGSRKALL